MAAPPLLYYTALAILESANPVTRAKHVHHQELTMPNTGFLQNYLHITADKKLILSNSRASLNGSVYVGISLKLSCLFPGAIVTSLPNNEWVRIRNMTIFNL